MDGDFALCESSAICTYVADKFPEKGMIPKTGIPERGQYNQWMSFATGEMDSQLMIMGKNGAPHYFPEITPDVKIGEVARTESSAAARAELLNFASIVETHLDGRAFLLDSGFSAVDPVMWWVLNAAKGKELLDGFPRLLSYVERLEKRQHFPVFEMPVLPG